MLTKEQIEFFNRFNKATRKEVQVEVFSNGLKEERQECDTYSIVYLQNRVYVVAPNTTSEKPGKDAEAFVVCVSNREPIRVEDCFVRATGYKEGKTVFKERLHFILKHRKSEMETRVIFINRDVKGGKDDEE